MLGHPAPSPRRGTHAPPLHAGLADAARSRPRSRSTGGVGRLSRTCGYSWGCPWGAPPRGQPGPPCERAFAGDGRPQSLLCFDGHHSYCPRSHLNYCSPDVGVSSCHFLIILTIKTKDGMYSVFSVDYYLHFLKAFYEFIIFLSFSFSKQVTVTLKFRYREKLYK